ncbi:alpha/beta fold hydrolase [Humibacter sp. RRB41]|uniref:alpha/beta fold hydrolase n=1 Tax=Humibacter sp. RRB41 TaxID=2919946 RepID=UPI001FA9741F|nr:alpha/beta hydrolase [Humibacter sp. RRB41]
MTDTTTIVLVPGFWLGGWAWDAVAERLRDDGFPVVALTLPGLESADADRSGVSLADHVGAVTDAVHTADSSVVLVGHSGAGEVITGAANAAPESIARLVFVDSGPAADGHVGSQGLGEDVIEIPLPSWDELEANGSSLGGLDDDALERFRSRAVPHPAGPAREPLVLHDDRRHAIPVTLICASFPRAQVKAMKDAGHPWFAELARFDTVDYVDVPTGHWPMWSRPDDTADAIAAVAYAVSSGRTSA